MSPELFNSLTARLDRIEGKLDAIQATGCARAREHDDMKQSISTLFNRVNDVKSQQDQAKGKAAMISAAVASVVPLALQWLGRQLP